MTIQECVYHTNFSVHFLLQYFVSVTFTKFLYMDTDDSLKTIQWNAANSQYAF